MGEKFKSCKQRNRIAKKFKAKRERATRRHVKAINRVNERLIEEEDHQHMSRRERRQLYVESLEHIRRRTTRRISRRITHGLNVKTIFFFIG